MMQRISALLSPNRPWLHLVYLGFFFFGWLYQPPGPQQALIALAGMAVFVALYVFSLRRRDWTVYPAALGAALLGFVFMPVTMGGAVYLVFAAAMLGWLPPSAPAHGRAGRDRLGHFRRRLADAATAFLCHRAHRPGRRRGGGCGDGRAAPAPGGR